MRYHLMLDADDTLWENNIYYEQAIHDFITYLNHSRLTHDEVRGVFNEIERGKGYGTAVFTNNLVEAYRRLAEKELADADVEEVRRIGGQIRTHPLELMAGVQDTLDYLSPRHDLYLLTKGDPAEQALKVERSGIQDFFRRVIIVQEKDVEAYHHVIEELGVDPRMTWMVGNSPRSDINPALAAGLNAAFIPHPHTWTLEHEEIVRSGDGQLLELERFSDLRSHF
jgi:putative hydrolase of the HAD superfamily